MAVLPTGPFDSSTVEPIAARDPLPPGVYLLHLIESENKPNAKGSGQHLSLTTEVLDGPHKGRRVWESLNIVNSNQMTVDLAYATLSAICKATGKAKFADTTELHNLPFSAEVEIRPARGEYKIGNQIKAYIPFGTMAVAPGVNGAAAIPAPVPGPATAPWNRGAASA